jgi:hypothetical protein
MAYTDEDFTSKKALKEAVAQGRKVTVYQPGPLGPAVKDGVVYLEGPHYPKPHRWWGQAIVKDGVIVGGVK